jgi:single-strand DNA-binding protein
MVRSSNNNGKVVVDFLIVAFVLFMIIKLLNTVRRKREALLTAPPKLSDLKVLLAEIRDLFTRGFEAVCTFALAFNRFFKQDEETQKEVSFFEVTTLSRFAEVCGEYLKKGRGVNVVGRLKQDRWSDAYDKGRSRVPIITEHREFKPQLKGRDGEEATEQKARSEADGNAAGEEKAVETANRSSYLSASTMAILYLRTRRRVPRCLNIE